MGKSNFFSGSGSPRKTTFDNLTDEERSSLMRKIKPEETKPEIIVRKALYRDNLRYRKNSRSLPGKPDISIIKYKLAIDIRGCFWHCHSGSDPVCSAQT